MAQNKFKLIVSNVSVNTNLVVTLNTRTTKEEASKEVGRILDAASVFDDYDWKIEGCEDGGINEFNDDLQKEILERIGEEEEPEDCLNWDGMAKIYEFELYDITVKTDVETALKSESKEDAITEVNVMINENKLFDGYDWNIKECSETGINKLDDSLKKEILDRLDGNVESCIAEGS